MKRKASEKKPGARQKQSTVGMNKFEKANEATEDEETKKKLEESLDLCKEHLRDAYMLFKDQKQRCVIDIDNFGHEAKGNHVFYFQPDTFLVDKPEVQKFFREDLINRISGMPKPEPIKNMGDDLHREFVTTIADQSTPKLSKRNLAAYYHRRQYMLQHLKYKLLCRWAHLALTAEQLDRIGLQATQMYGKIEYSIEQAMSRAERLAQDDKYDMAKPENRPHTKADFGTGPLYVEDDLLPPQSLIREDDVEIYCRGTTYKNKVLKVMNKFLARLKWLPLQHRYEIFEKAVRANHKQREANIEAQHIMIKKMKSRMRKLHTGKKDFQPNEHNMQNYEADEHLRMTPELENDLKEIVDHMYATKYNNFFQGRAEKFQSSWRADHDIVPDFVANVYQLKIRILATASQYGLDGDIELDQGYSFAYNISTNFPSYFQKQVIKGQFTLYDGLGHDDDDKNTKQKNILSNITQVDCNIFKDIYTVKTECPTNESLNLDLKQSTIKVIRLKSCGYWIDYVCLVPNTPDWTKKQDAILNNENPIDSLVASAMNYLDVNDLASVNRINEDSAILHQNTLKKQAQHNPHQTIVQRSETTQDGVKQIALDHSRHINAANDAHNMDKHMLKTIKGEGYAITGDRNGDRNTTGRFEAPSKNMAKVLPTHLLVSYYTLRYMKSRDAKTKILYALNYFRATQKRLALDLREFGTRERIDSHLKEPFIYSKEAKKNQVTSGMASTIFDSSGSLNSKKTSKNELAKDLLGDRRLKVFDMAVLENMTDMASMRAYKCNGFFNNQIMRTCPAFPKFHFTFGEQTTRETEDMEADHNRKRGGISEKSIKLMGRVNTIEFDMKAEEVYVKDDFGVYILYDCSLQDMRSHEEYLIKICSYYLRQSEVLQDPHDDKPMPNKDRLDLLEDLLTKEASFQFKKVLLVQAYMEAYEHISDPLEQQRIMQIMTNLMSRRPRLNMQANYFVDSYDAELALLDKEHELITMLIDTQVSIEKTENKNLQDSLCWSYSLAQKFDEKKWKYSDAETVLRNFAKEKKQNKENAVYVKNQMQQARIHEERRKTALTELIQTEGLNEITEERANAEGQGHPMTPSSMTEKDQTQHTITSRQESVHSPKIEPAAVEDDQEPSDDSSDEYDEKDYFKPNENAFQSLLGLPEISIETLYQSYREKDKAIVTLMNEHANFISIHEGYPEFLTYLEGGSGSSGLAEKVRTFKVNPWSQECGNLDFYVSLDFVNKLYATQQEVSQQLYDALKPWNASMMTYIDTQMIEKSIQEFQRVREFFEGRETEYDGHQYVEDESILGDSEKMIFYSKEMIANLTLTTKAALDPYQICKLDIMTINSFEFPKVKQEEGKYLMQREKGTQAYQWMIHAHKQAMVDIGKNKCRKIETELANGFVGVGVFNSEGRRIEVPSLLHTYCNMLELSRLRHEIIIARSETAVLQEVYQHQMSMCNVKNIKCQTDEPVIFEQFDQNETPLVNYVDEGPAYKLKIDLAIAEFDDILLSNFNFRNPDAFKLSITTAGLEEVRTILLYQLMQKQLLIVATRINQLLIDHHMKAISEIKLLEEHEITVPNPNINFEKVYSKNNESLNVSLLHTERARFKSDMTKIGQQAFYNMQARKTLKKTDVALKYKTYMNKVVDNPIYKLQTCQRILRCFKLMQVNRYCQDVLLKVQLDAQKATAIQTCQRLRVMSRYFDFDMNKLGSEDKEGGKEDSHESQVFRFETHNPMLENIPNAYMKQAGPDSENDPLQSSDQIRVLNGADFDIHDYFGIPSSLSIMATDCTNVEDIKKFREAHKSALLRKHQEYQDELTNVSFEDKYCEDNLKKMLPSFTPCEEGSTRITEQTTSEQQQQEKTKPQDDQNIHLIKKHGYSIMDYEEAMNYSHSKFARLMRYYQHLERVFSLEWFIYKLQFKPNEVIFMDQAFECGLPFWHETPYERRIKGELPETSIADGINPLAQKILYSKIVARKTKKDIAEEINGMSMLMRNLITKFQKNYATTVDISYEYLHSYTEFRYMQIISSLQKLMAQFYINEKMPLSTRANAVKCVRDAISEITKMDHVRVSFSRTNSYHVNTGLVHPQFQLLNSSSLIAGAYNEEERQNFKRCVQPVINEKALEPAQLTLFQSLYQTDNFRKKMPTQYSGQFVSTHNSVAFQSLECALLDMSQKERAYSQSYIVQLKYQANDFMETAQGESSLKTMQNEDVYTLPQLDKAKAFITDQTQSLLLKNAVICWKYNTVLPYNPQVYEKYEKGFKQDFFWKIVQQKENIIKAIGGQGKDTGIPTKERLKELKDSIQKLLDDYTLATKDEEAQRDKMVKLLNEEFSEMKKKVCYDNMYANKAEIQVLKNEIEKFLVRASTQALENEHKALIRCFDLTQTEVRYHIHPFQQFAATFYDDVDPNMHLDVSNKLRSVQTFLTQLRNRGTKVDTLTSGPGMVFTIKDLNESLQAFCTEVIKYGEQELKSRTDQLTQVHSHFTNMVYAKDQRIANLERRAVLQQKNIENLVNAKMFEKGNQLIYELDSQGRLLALFKQTMFALERDVRSNILGEMSHKIKLQKTQVDKANDQHEQYLEFIKSNVTVGLTEEADMFLKEMQSAKEKIVAIGQELVDGNRVDWDEGRKQYYPKAREPVGGGGAAPGRSSQMSSNSKSNGQPQVVVRQFDGTLVPSGFVHKSHCICWQPNPDYPWPSMDMAKAEMMSEQTARQELAQNIDQMRKMRIFQRTEQMNTTQKFQDQINLMKKQLNNNSYLWDQMAEAEKRESILKQELLFTQQSLASAEKVIEKLQEEMKKLEAERERLAKYRNKNGQELKDLQERVKKAEVFENIDTEKLIDVLGKKDDEVRDLKDVAKGAQARVDNAENKRQKEVKSLNNRFLKEQIKTQQIVDKMEQMKLELKMLESNDTSVASIWKKKCLDLFEVCQTLKGENEELRDRCKELISQGIQLADAMSQNEDLQGAQSLSSPQPGRNNVSLPKLMANNTSVQRINAGIIPQTKVNPLSAGVGSGRHAAVSTANTYHTQAFRALGQVTPARESQRIDYSSAHGEASIIEDNAARMASVQDVIQNGKNPLQPNTGESTVTDGSFIRNPNQFASTLNQRQSKNFDVLQTPQQTSQLSKTSKHTSHGPNRRVRMGAGNAPQTSHQNQRGRTMGASGPTYQMPQSQGQGRNPTQPNSRPTMRQKQDLRSILGGGGFSGSDSLAQSFHGQFTSMGGNTAQIDLSKKMSPALKQTNAQRGHAAPSSTQMTYTTMQVSKEQQIQNQMAFRRQQAHHMHNDSLFESSKASTAHPHRGHHHLGNLDSNDSKIGASMNKRHAHVAGRQAARMQGFINAEPKAGAIHQEVTPDSRIKAGEVGGLDSSIFSKTKKNDSIFGKPGSELMMQNPDTAQKTSALDGSVEVVGSLGTGSPKNEADNSSF